MILEIICIAIAFMTGCCFGYVLSVRDGLLEFSKVIGAVENLNESWVSYAMYKEVVDKYDATVKEYEQYKGCIKALQDFKDGG